MAARTRTRKPAEIVEAPVVEIEEDETVSNVDPLDDLDTETEATEPDSDLFDGDDTDEDGFDLEDDGLDEDEDGDGGEDDSTGETDEEYMQRLLDALRQEMGVVMEAPVLEHILGVADFVNDFRRRHLAE